MTETQHGSGARVSEQRNSRATTSDKLCEEVLSWVDAAVEHGVSIRVIEAESGYGKTFVAQSLFDQLATQSSLDTEGKNYWKPGLAPSWPPTRPQELEQKRKTVIPNRHLRDASEGNRTGFGWIGLPLGEVAETGHLGVAEEFVVQFEQLIGDIKRMSHSQIHGERKRTARKKSAKIAAGVATKIVTAVVSAPVVTAVQQGKYIFGTGKSLFDTWKESLVDPSDEYQQELESSILNALHFAREQQWGWETEGLANDPLVIVLDDAHAVDVRVLRLLEILTGLRVPHDREGRETKGSIDGDSSQNIEDPADEWMSPLHGIPILIVATAWPGESKNLYGGIFDEWLDLAKESLSQLDGAVEVVSLEPVPLETASEYLESSQVQSADAKLLLDHLSVPHEGQSVNFLVLANARAEIDEYVQNQMVKGIPANVILDLPIAPSFHSEGRIETLRKDEPLGKITAEQLKIFALWGRSFPFALSECLVESLDIEAKLIIDLLAKHRLVAVDHSSDLKMIRIQTDIHAHLVKNTNAVYAEPLAGVMEELRSRFLESVRDYWGPTREVFSVVRRSFDLKAKDDSVPTTPLQCMAAYLNDFGSSFEHETRLAVLEQAIQFGNGEIAAEVALTLEGLIRDKERKRDILRPFIHRKASAAAAYARTLTDEAEIREVLSPFVAHKPSAAIELARNLTDREEIRQLVKPFVSFNSSAAFEFARTLTDENEIRDVLRPFVDRSSYCAVLYARTLTDNAKIREVLQPFIGRHYRAAFEYIRTLTDKTEIRAVLQPFLSKDSAMALEYAETLSDKAEIREILQPFVHRSAKAAVAYAATLTDMVEVGELLKPFVETSARAAVAYSATLTDKAEVRDVLEPFVGANAAAAVAYAGTLSNALQIREMVEPFVAQNSAAAVAYAKTLDSDDEIRRVVAPFVANDVFAALAYADAVTDKAEIRKVLEPFIQRSGRAAVAFAETLDDTQLIREVLAPFVAKNAAAAVAYSKTLESGEEIRGVLARFAKRDVLAAVTYARTLKDKAEIREVLEPFIHRFGRAAIAYARTLEKNEEIQRVLSPFVDRDEGAAIAYARTLTDHSKIREMLEPFIHRSARAAVAYADTESDAEQVRELLQPFVSRNAAAAVAYAKTLESDDQVRRILVPFIKRDEGAAIAYARTLTKKAKIREALEPFVPRSARAAVLYAEALSDAKQIREVLKPFVNRNAAAALAYARTLKNNNEKRRVLAPFIERDVSAAIAYAKTLSDRKEIRKVARPFRSRQRLWVKEFPWMSREKGK